MNKDQNPNIDRLCLAGFIAAAAVLRLNGLTANDLWADELFSWRLTRLSIGELLAALGADIHPPLYFILLKAFVSLFGDSLMSLRIFQALPSIATVGLTFVFARARVDRTTAAMAAAIVLLSPASIYYAHQVRAYALCEMMSVVVAAAMSRYARTRRPIDLVAFALAATAMNYLHFIGPFFLAGVFALAAYLAATGRIARPAFLAVVLALALASAVLVPWLWYLLSHSRVVGTQVAVFTGIAGVVEAAKVFVKLLGGMFAAIPALLVGSAGLWCVMNDRSRDRAAFWSALLLACVPFGLFALQGIAGGPFIRLHPAIVVVPWIAMALACGLRAMPAVLRMGLGAVYALALVHAAATIPYKISQVPFSAVLDAVVEAKLDYLIVFSDEPELTQRFLREDRVRFLDIRRLPSPICARKVGLEVTANDAEYDPAAHRVTYGLAAPGGPIRAYDLPASLKLGGALGFDYENTWKPRTVMTYRVLIFDVMPDPSCLSRFGK